MKRLDKLDDKAASAQNATYLASRKTMRFLVLVAWTVDIPEPQLIQEQVHLFRSTTDCACCYYNSSAEGMGLIQDPNPADASSESTPPAQLILLMKFQQYESIEL